MKNTKTYTMILMAFFAALTAIFTQISIPIGPVPINLALLSVFAVGGILGCKKATISQAIYILIGAVGAPVFSGFQGGISKLVGPTGGYLIGYVIAAFAVGLITDRFGIKAWVLVVSMVVGLTLCYAFGTAWFMIYTGTPLWSALVLCVFPFLIGDAAKIAVATVLVKSLKRFAVFPQKQDS